MGPNKFRLSLIFLQVIQLVLGSNLEHDGWVTIKLSHALAESEQPRFTERGNITIQSLRSGRAVVNQDPLTPEDSSRIQELAAGNSYYQVKSHVTSNGGDENTFLSTIKACMLAEAELDDRLSISLDYAGNVIGVTSIIASRAACEGANVPVDKLAEFTTSVYVRHTETGPVPDTASYIQKLDREREAKERGEVKDNRSFLAKYWMYILPAVVLMMISSMANPEAGGGGGGGAAR